MTGKVTRMGRKPLAPAKRRSEWAKFRVNQSERERLTAKAEQAGLSLSDYLREKGLAS